MRPSDSVAHVSPPGWLDYFLLYDENPRFYVISMHSMSIVSLFLFLLSGYCVLKKKKSVSSAYRKLLLLYMIVNICSQISWTSFYLPHLILPYTAGNTLGLFRLLGLAPELQLTLQFSLLGFLGGTTVLMFAYRYFVLLPPGHLCKRKPVYRSFLATVFAGSALIPPPLIAWSCYSSDGETVKDNLVKRFGYISRDLFDSQTLAFEMSLGSPLFITTIYLTVCICLMASFIIGIMRKIAAMFSLCSTSLSVSVRRDHRSLTKMLYVQTAVTFGLISLPFTAFSIFMWFGIPACGILHICFVVYSFADPASSLITIYMHSPFRAAVGELLVWIGILKAPVALPSSRFPRAGLPMFHPNGFMWYPDASFGYPLPVPPPALAETQSPAYLPHPPSPLKEEFDETIPIDPVGNGQNVCAVPPIQGQEQRDFPHPMLPFYPPYMFLPPPPFPPGPINSPSWQSFNPVPPMVGGSPRKKNGQKSNARRFPEHIKAALITRYQLNRFISGREREAFAMQLGLTVEQVKIWFQNQRYKDRKMATTAGDVEKLSPKNRTCPPSYPL